VQNFAEMKKKERNIIAHIPWLFGENFAKFRKRRRNVFVFATFLLGF
jgi:hypothetical protein